ncbi:MAG TPA: hypothetical protein VN192_01505 [Flavobacterium sp.]|nr:hypothetical protein [Flavobacterium sp.]
MKSIIIAFLLLFSFISYAQKPCEFSTNISDSIGVYKATKGYLIYEKVFAGNSNYIFASFVLTDSIPTLNLQFVEKSMDFIKAKCFDKNSKIYLQLINGKIVTLNHIDKLDCGAMIRDDNNNNNRILTGTFTFTMQALEELKNSPVSLIRIKFSTEAIDYIFKNELISELDGKTYNPENYFMDYLHCIFGEN